MKKSNILPVAVMGALLIATSSVALAGDMTTWIGRDTDNNRLQWTVRSAGGDSWILKRNGVDWGSYETVVMTKEYIEVQARGTTRFDRIRIYSDRIAINKLGARFQFLPMAKGKWHN